MVDLDIKHGHRRILRCEIASIKMSRLNRRCGSMNLVPRSEQRSQLVSPEASDTHSSSGNLPTVFSRRLLPQPNKVYSGFSVRAVLHNQRSNGSFGTGKSWWIYNSAHWLFTRALGIYVG